MVIVQVAEGGRAPQVVVEWKVVAELVGAAIWRV